MLLRNRNGKEVRPYLYQRIATVLVTLIKINELGEKCQRLMQMNLPFIRRETVPVRVEFLFSVVVVRQLDPINRTQISVEFNMT